VSASSLTARCVLGGVALAPQLFNASDSTVELARHHRLLDIFMEVLLETLFITVDGSMVDLAHPHIQHKMYFRLLADLKVRVPNSAPPANTGTTMGRFGAAVALHEPALHYPLHHTQAAAPRLTGPNGGGSVDKEMAPCSTSGPSDYRAEESNKIIWQSQS
jgi:hypothetical protein